MAEHLQGMSSPQGTLSHVEVNTARNISYNISIVFDRILLLFCQHIFLGAPFYPAARREILIIMG